MNHHQHKYDKIKNTLKQTKINNSNNQEQE